MEIRTIDAQYDLLKFELTVIEGESANTTVLEMLLDYPLEDFDERFFNDKIFLLVVNNEFYTFKNFTVNEFYVEDEFLKVICVK